MAKFWNDDLSRRAVLGGLGLMLPASLLAQLRDDALAALNAHVRRQMAAARIPGLALGLARDGRLIFAQGYGFADRAARRAVEPDTVFHIASITKTVTAMAISRLAEVEGFSLDDPVARHLDFEVVGDAEGRITWRHLLMHTSGISDRVYYEVDFRRRGADSPVRLEEFLRDYLAAGGRHAGNGNLASPPGSRWDYSNVGYGLLGHLAERVTGQDFRDWIDERLFRPLGLDRMAWRLSDLPPDVATPYDLVDGAPVAVDPVGFPDWPAGMLRASVVDLTRLAAVAANGGVGDGHRLLGGDANAAMLGMARPDGLPDWLSGQGLGWQQSLLDDTPRINHWGGDPGVFTVTYLDPEARSAVVVLSNLTVTPQSRIALKAIVSEGFRVLRDG